VDVGVEINETSYGPTAHAEVSFDDETGILTTRKEKGKPQVNYQLIQDCSLALLKKGRWFYGGGGLKIKYPEGKQPMGIDNKPIWKIVLAFKNEPSTLAVSFYRRMDAYLILLGSAAQATVVAAAPQPAAPAAAVEQDWVDAPPGSDNFYAGVGASSAPKEEKPSDEAERRLLADGYTSDDIDAVLGEGGYSYEGGNGQTKYELALNYFNSHGIFPQGGAAPPAATPPVAQLTQNVQITSDDGQIKMFQLPITYDTSIGQLKTNIVDITGKHTGSQRIIYSGTECHDGDNVYDKTGGEGTLMVVDKAAGVAAALQPQVALPQQPVAAASLEPQRVTHSSIIYGDPISTLHQLRDAGPGTLVLFDIDDTLIRREKSWVRVWDDTQKKYVDRYEPQVKSLDENLLPLLEQLTGMGRDVSILALTARYHNEHLATKRELGSKTIEILQRSPKFSDLDWSGGEDKKYEEGIIYCTDRQVDGVDPKVHAFKQLQDYFLRKGITNIIYVDDLQGHIDHMSAYFKTLHINTLVVQYTLGSQLSFLSDIRLTEEADRLEQYLIDEALTRLKSGGTLLDVKTDISQKSDTIKTLLQHGFKKQFAIANANAILESIKAEAIANPDTFSYKFFTPDNIVTKARIIQSGSTQ